MPSITYPKTTRITYVVWAPEVRLRGQGNEIPKITDREKLPKVVDHYRRWER